MMRPSVLSALIISACAIFARHLYLGDINWHHEYVELAYHMRGWQNGLLLQYRTFTTEQIAWLGGTVLVFLWSAVSIHRSAGK